ncbi:MAG TPA: aspartate aminotransferase family protein [Chromatiaceae bacterium]|nr:aspartate aminotransferase family protein [Chromatiaceae bacterium]
MPDPLMATYARLPVTFSHGEGCRLFDDQGASYLDAIAGIAVCGLGHAHPSVSQALCDQASKLVHTSNLYGIANQQLLGERLTALAGMDRVFFGNSGAEANEAAIKIARLYGHRKGIGAPAIIVTENSFHGRTMATLSATGNRKVQAGFEPLVSGFVRVPYNDLEAIRQIASSAQNVVAVLVEPIQGEGGVNIPDKGYLQGIRQLCDDNDWLMMVDEIQTGMGRTGKWFACQHEDILPDVMTLAKALGNGVPIGACLASGWAAEILAPGNHGSTFGGNPLACAAALAVIEIMHAESLPSRAEKAGERLLAAFNEALQSSDGVVDIRARGLMIGIELDRPCAELVTRALSEKLLINVTAGNVVRLLPPLIISDAECDELASRLGALIRDFLREETSP